MSVKKLLCIVAVFVMLASHTRGQTLHAPVWTYHFADPNQLNATRISGRPETSRSAGIAIWDENHILIYSLVSTGALSDRHSQNGSAGAWAFLVRILNSHSGETSQSFTLHAGSFSSELALTNGGIIVSDPGQLTFYSRSFAKVSSGFQYKPLVDSVKNLSPLFARSVSGHIYSTPDGSRLLLIDSYGHHARSFLFDGENFTAVTSAYLEEIDPRSVSLGDHGFFYTDMNSLTHVYYCGFATGTEECKSTEDSPPGTKGHEPVYLASDRWLDVLHTVSLVDSKGTKVLYNERKGEGVLGPSKISSTGRMAVVFMDEVESGGIFDRDLHRTEVSLLVLSLEVKGKTCKISITPTPQRQFNMIFVSDTRLVIINDATVSGYDILCAI